MTSTLTDGEWATIANRIFSVWPQCKEWIERNSPDPNETVRGWRQRLAAYTADEIHTVISKMLSSRLPSLGAWDHKQVAEIIARHVRDGRNVEKKRSDASMLIEMAQRTVYEQIVRDSRDDLALLDAWYQEEFDQHGIPNDGRNRMMLAREEGLDEIIKRDIRHRWHLYQRSHADVADHAVAAADPVG